ncbi:hypothetical protein Q9295_01000 [Xinfangfangia sp. CPCC 101601]|uniref:AAA+ family ATPase n=1 Tax=Pseudogemmobacter lacusdianii TaxID=3069608 RepID=A0ABU0VT92_9RHOB|nr:hypothetical protein [Xinfangfangia sp. CPCC 101601]MDQ2064937.1 hypothetical protein [Xinfangfangia sp. CPCC 101601]
MTRALPPSRAATATNAHAAVSRIPASRIPAPIAAAPLALALTFALAASLALPAKAQSSDLSDLSEKGSSLMEEGGKLILRGLLSEMEPALDDMARALDEARPLIEEIGPQISQLLEVMGDIRYYERPLILPNGDIIIRRSKDAPPYDPSARAPSPSVPRKAPELLGPVLPGPNGETEL